MACSSFCSAAFTPARADPPLLPSELCADLSDRSGGEGVRAHRSDRSDARRGDALWGEALRGEPNDVHLVKIER